MKKAFRYLLPILLLMLLTLPALADGYEFADDLTGEYLYPDRKSTRLNSSHPTTSRMPSSA